MEKSRYRTWLYILFAVMVGVTLFNLYGNIIWLSAILAASFLVLLALHIKYNRTKPAQSKKTFVLAFLILINFLLANAVVVIAEFVYPY
jgi:O-antigen/teichoic acid export membrane protein